MYMMDDSFLTGCELIDKQHRQLFDVINILTKANGRGLNRDVVAASLRSLSDYAIRHFFDEEQLIKKYGFAGTEAHVRYHTAFKETVRDFYHEVIQKGVTESLATNMESKIYAWLSEHIKGQDFVWVKELKSKVPELFSE